jgi:hypothetical protein
MLEKHLPQFQNPSNLETVNQEFECRGGEKFLMLKGVLVGGGGTNSLLKNNQSDHPKPLWAN